MYMYFMNFRKLLVKMQKNKINKDIKLIVLK